MEDVRVCMAVQLNQEFRDTIWINRQMFCSVVEKTVLCSHQNIAFHGH